MCDKIILANDNTVNPFLLEESAEKGVLRIAEKVAQDVENVCGKKPALIQSPDSDTVVFVATLGKSALLDEMVKNGKVDAKELEGKREVFCLKLLDKPFAGVEKALVILGSDKLGTIYGLFALSEYIGVSPMCYWGDADPCKQKELVLQKDIERTSKEPSVKYRGFFINDEWPCFGNWTFGHFNGFTAEMYDKVFEFLLRMKGNFLWPAMWTSSFCLDGPGSLNEELADLYGITISYSHHEPCLRASEEWDLVRGENSPYGNEWNFYTNKEGLTNYWADALKRSGKYKHLITIGMRGERDSSMLGEDATLKDNIDLLKDIITTQRKLIGEHVNSDVDSVPQLLALYKEVEAYFYGDENAEGLKEWKELENVIFMLCEDNFGHMRTLPTKDIRDHKGGFGMYYHFDYHGGPVSYEWMPSTTMALTWEQMTQAYDYGIKDVWIVNVGDLKGNEVALQYFLTLAYDFETWGSAAPNSWQKYLSDWAKKTFPAADDKLQENVAKIYRDFVQMNFTRRPETLHSGVYHPCNYGETDELLEQLDALEQLNESTFEAMPEMAKNACYSMITHPARCSINLIRMQLLAGKNAHYAMQGRKIANEYGEQMVKCIALDKELSEKFGAFRDGKWKGMELEKHVGFTKWNDDGWKYPVQMTVFPVDQPRMSVSRADEERMAVKNYGTPICIPVHDFMDMACEKVTLEISNDGEGVLPYKIEAENGQIPEWLLLSKTEGEVESLERVIVSVDRTKMAEEICSSCSGHGGACGSLNAQTVRLLITALDTTVAVEVKAQNPDLNKVPEKTFLPKGPVCVMEARHFHHKKNAAGGEFTLLEGYGRTKSGMKVLPSTLDFTMEEERPELTYAFMLEEGGEYIVELWSAPVNSLQNKRPLNVAVAANEEAPKMVEVLSSDYRGGENSEGRWCQGVIEQIRKTKTELTFSEGLQTITVGALEAGFVLEKILLYKKGTNLKPSFLGPKESYIKK